MKAKTILWEVVMFFRMTFDFFHVNWTTKDAKDKRLSTVRTFSAVLHLKKTASFMLLTDDMILTLSTSLPHFLQTNKEEHSFLGENLLFQSLLYQTHKPCQQEG